MLGEKKNQKKNQLTVTPAQVTAPVQLEALPVAVRRADGESVARQEVWSPRAALGQSLRLVQLLTLRTLLCSRSGHANISRIGIKGTPDAAHVRVNLQHNREGSGRGLWSTSFPGSFQLGRKNKNGRMSGVSRSCCQHAGWTRILEGGWGGWKNVN